MGRAEAGLLASETHAFIDDKGETDMAEFDFNESHHGYLVGISVRIVYVYLIDPSSATSLFSIFVATPFSTSAVTF